MYPYGCDLDDPWEALGFLIPYTVDGGGGMSASAGNHRPPADGAQYLGFTARHRALLAPSSWAAYGYWVHEGIDCPSGDFHDCTGGG